MTHPDTEQIANTEYLRRWNRRIMAGRVPLTGSMALTHRCNLKCTQCYAGPAGAAADGAASEIGTSAVQRVLDEITAAGCLFLVLTGGEPLLRADFHAIYRRARTNGLMVTVFTNGTTLTEEALDLFGEFPPRAIEVSLYGATAQTYEKITGTPGSFARCVRGIETLLRRGLPVRLKTLLLAENRDEFDAIEEMARQYGVQFRFDAAIFPRLDGDQRPTALRVAPEQVVRVERENAERKREWAALFERYRETPPSDTLYVCGAARTAFHIDPYGYLYPCVMVRGVKYNLVSGSFSEGWNAVGTAVRARKSPSVFPCRECGRKILCGYCPGFFELETGSETTPSHFLCSLGGLRLDMITQAANARRNGEIGARDGESQGALQKA